MVRNILFVDDDAILCSAVTKSLAQYRESFTVVTACDGFDAVKQLKNVSVSLVIVELRMPRMDGMSLVSHLCEHYPDIPTIIISSMDEMQLQKLAKASGIIGYLKKPFQVDRLVAAINRVLQHEAAGGIMHDISPPVFLQLMEMDVKSCTIRIIDKATQQGGILYFQEGELLDARIGALHGIEAAYELFSWNSATIFMRNECEPRKNAINSELTPIIMKAVGMKDEAESPQTEDSADPPLELSDVKEMTSSLTAARIELLKNELGKELGLRNCVQDAQVTQAVAHLTEINKKESYGAFRFGYISHNKNHRIVLSGQPPTVLDIVPTCPPDKIIGLLVKKMG
jgi:DNA-binding response OmpR family regulator